MTSIAAIGRILLLATSVALLSGCQYHMQGTVVSGAASSVEVVDSDDSRLAQPGLAGVTVEATLDPSEMKPIPQAPVSSDGTGRFAMPIQATGAGVLQYQALVVARLSGCKPATQLIALPGPGQRLLITLAPGVDVYRPKENLLRETLRLGETLQRP